MARVKPIVRRLCRRLAGRLTAEYAASRPSRVLIAVMREANWIPMSAAEIHAVVQRVRGHPNCRFIIFGAGHDSRLWVNCNRDFTTVFLEHNAVWAEKIARERGGERILDVSYTHRRSDWRRLIDAPDPLECGLPAELTAAAWDVVHVDGPPGSLPQQPGRMQSIFTAARLVRPGGYVIVHDCDREAEAVCCDRFLGAENLQIEVDVLRHR